ncbi:DUF4980 domain-containing protein [Prevotella koreensis]|uniref:DUF4980 domain-containing protein n=2 Tax=Prevotella koreensis TaxID=2490854 RepID=A0A3S0P9C3_9BACT|nr:DUF4980 domain-containing protein [Prevotella koreensis]
MFNRFLITFLLAMTFVFAKAQHQPMILGENHAMLRISSDKTYLLLPVHESEENAEIAVLDNHNEVVKRLNVRLAVDKVDSYVPLDLSKLNTGHPMLLDIVFHGERRQVGVMKDFVCWKTIKNADEFDTTNREHFRPIYHHTPQYGWMNDPNGMFYKDGVWHLYFQLNPYGSQWENMTWGHSTSRDLIHWNAEPLAIEADGLGAIFSGSCIIHGDDVIAFYTTAGRHQTQSMAISKDGGQTFTKYDGNPIITSDKPDFRDPKVFWHEDTKRWIMLIAVGQEMQIFSSTDLKDWQYESEFGQEYGAHGGVWECPDLFKIDNKWVLICNINPGGLFGGSATQYFVGDFDGHKFTCESMPKVMKWLDYGKDHYATVSFHNAPDNRHVVLAWMSNWQYGNKVPTEQFRSANSIPRDLRLFNYNNESYVSVIPSEEMLALRGAKVKKPTEACEIVVDVKGQTEIVLSNARGEQVTFVYDKAKETFTMDRTKSGDTTFNENFPAVTVAPIFGQMKQLRIFIDRCSIEAFDAEGKMSMTNLVFPSEPYNNIKIKGGKATIYQISE